MLSGFVIELQEQAYELGFESLEEALNSGYKVDNRALVEGEARLVKEEDA